MTHAVHGRDLHLNSLIAKLLEQKSCKQLEAIALTLKVFKQVNISLSCDIHAEWKVLQLSLSDFVTTSVLQKPEGVPLRGWKRKLAGQLQTKCNQTSFLWDDQLPGSETFWTQGSRSGQTAFTQKLWRMSECTKFQPFMALHFSSTLRSRDAKRHGITLVRVTVHPSNRSWIESNFQKGYD